MLAAAATLLTAGCGLGGPIGDAEIPRPPGEPGDRILRLSHPYEPGHPFERCGVSTLQEELLGSGVTVESYPSAQLGSEAESLEQAAEGGLDLVAAGASFLGTWHPPAAVLDGAYLFDDVEEFTAAVEGPTVRRVHEELRAKTGLRALSTWYFGTRHITSDEPVDGPADLDGVKIRTPDAPLYLTNLALMEAVATPMAFGEVYLALQQGTLDAQESPLPAIESSGFQDVQRYLNLTGHMVQGVHLVTADAVWTDLTAEQRARLDEAIAAAGDEVRDCVLAEEREILQRWLEDGSLLVHEPDVDVFADTVREELPTRVPWGELYTEIREGR